MCIDRERRAYAQFALDRVERGLGHVVVARAVETIALHFRSHDWIVGVDEHNVTGQNGVRRIKYKVSRFINARILLLMLCIRMVLVY